MTLEGMTTQTRMGGEMGAAAPTAWVRHSPPKRVSDGC